MFAANRHSSLVMFLAALLLFAETPSTALSGNIRVLTEITGRSAMYQHERLTGWGVEMVQELMRRTGDVTKIEPLPWGRAYEIALHTPNVALFSTTRTKERDNLFHWVGPLVRLEWNFVARKGSGIVINSLDDARWVGAIGTYINDARDRFLMDQGFTNLDRATSSDTNYRKLDYGRLDLIVSTNIDRARAETALRAGVTIQNMEVVYTIKEMDLYLALSKGTSPKTIKAWQEGFRTMQEDGTFQRILHKWHPGMEPPMDVRRPWLDDQ